MAGTKTALGKLLDALRSQRLYVPSTLIFPRIDIPAMSERLRLIERGEENGRANRPPTDAAQPDRVQSEIAALIQSEYDEAVDIYRQGLINYDRRIYGNGLETLGTEIDAAAQEAVAEYILVAHKARDEILFDRKDLDEVENEFEDFRRQNRLSRGCRFSERHITHIGIALLVVFLDTCANGYLLSGRNAFGLLGGMLQAIVIAGMNVALGFVAGRFLLPNFFHRSIYRRFGGLLPFSMLLCLIFVLNLSFAHYRDLSVLGIASPGQKALSEVLQTPLTLHDVKSWWLACMGLVFAFVSLADGFKWDDPYPGYGELARRRNAKREEYLDRKHYWLHEISQKREHARAEVNEIRREINMIQGEIGQANMGRSGFTASFFAHASHLEAAANQLIATYCDANRRARTTPAPSCFEQPWCLTRTEMPVPIEMDRDLLRKQVEGITASLSDSLTKIHELHNETIRAFDQLHTRDQPAPEPTRAIRLVASGLPPIARGES